MTTTRDDDAKALAAAYQSVEERAAAFMNAMEVALPLYQALVEARKVRSDLKTDFRVKHLGPKPQSMKTE